MALRRLLPLGTVLELYDVLGELKPGFYVLTALDIMATVRRLGEKKEVGLIPVGPAYRVTLTDLKRFKKIDMWIPVHMEE